MNLQAFVFTGFRWARELLVKGYKSRWGSCCSDGRLQFNWRLWQAPDWVIDYVIVHELCHRVYPNHSKAFWALVMQHYPKTNEAKRMIKQQGKRWIKFLEP
ncbi:MAG: M48 family metallopeptidase [Thiomicrorhabdus sp.]|nr:M48 family metallopeptidase [Thiomicrorhabdus sp.]